MISSSLDHKTVFVDKTKIAISLSLLEIPFFDEGAGDHPKNY